MQARNTQRVAVVHGRNALAREATWRLLHGLGLEPREWERVILDLGHGTPHTFEVVQELFREIQAVVVLLTPDETAYLRASLRSDSDDEARPAGQPRQNVLIEAGMAFGLHRTRTVLVEIGKIRHASDFDGMNVIRINRQRDTKAMSRLADRLEAAGCVIDRRGDHYLDTKVFDQALESIDAHESQYPDLLFRDTDRAVTLAESIQLAGLSDIENRNDDRHGLPPARFYRRARSEVVVSGITLARTFDQNGALLVEMLRSGIQIRALLLHPDSPDVPPITRREEDRDIRHDILHTLELAARRYGMFEGFSVRLMERMPPFTAVMIDGDVAARHAAPRDSEGEVRVQPGTAFGTQHEGLVMAFRKRSADAGGPLGIFDYFAEDLRNQWHYAKAAAR